MKYKAMFAAVFVAGLTVAVSGQVNKAEALLGTGLHQEEVEGNCKEAIKTYQKVIQEKNALKPVAARAQLHIGVCQEKLGLPEARASYELIISRYADQTDLVTAARGRLANINSGQQDLRIERILEGPDVDVEGRLTPDGRYFVFTDWSAGFGNLAIRDLRTGEKRTLTSGATYEAFVENPLPSPDGKRIAYRFGEDSSSIRLIHADGTNMQVLLRDRHDNYLVAWSPDGRYLAAVHDNGDRTDAIVLISTKDGGIKQLKSPQGASVGGFSPDGRFLVYAKNNDPKEGDGGVFALAVDGSGQNRLVEGSKQGPTTFGAPFWSPDGSRVIFMSNRGAAGLWSIRVANGQPQGNAEPIRGNIPNMRPRTLARDGSFYYVVQQNFAEAYIADFDPVTMTVLNSAPISDRAIGNNRGPELSPDGASVALIRQRNIIVRSLASGEERPVGSIFPAYGARTLQWFPDGRSLLAMDRTSGQKKRFRQIDVQSGEASFEFEGPWEIWTGALSADGDSIFYSIKEGEILRLVKRHIATGNETELYSVESDGTGLFGLAASPDGNSLAFTRNLDDGSRGLFVLSTDGGAPREIYRSGAGEPAVMDIRWTRDSQTLITVASERGVHKLFAIPAIGGSLKPLGLGINEIATPSISPDGRRIAFEASNGRKELWVVRNLLSELEKRR